MYSNILVTIVLLLNIKPFIASEKHVIRFKVSAGNLVQKDTPVINGLSDPFVEVYEYQNGQSFERDIGKSAVINNNLNPKWVTIFEVDYEEETKWNQTLIFRLFDKDDVGPNEKLGNAAVNVREFVLNGQQMTVKIIPQGTLTLAGNQPGGIKCYECVSHSKSGFIQNQAFGEKSCEHFYNAKDSEKDGFIKSCSAGSIGCIHTIHEYQDGIDKVERLQCYSPRQYDKEFNSLLKPHGCNSFTHKKVSYKACRCTSDLCVLGGFRL